MAEFPWGDEAAESYYRRMRVRHQSSTFSSPRGLPLFAQSWTPLSPAPPRAWVFMVHGYGNDTSWTFQKTAILFTQLGCAAFALDLEGHGRSPGLRGFIPSVDNLAKDCLAYFKNIKATAASCVPHCFLYGESLGAAICLLVHFLEPTLVDGAILVAPMCRISDRMRPPWPIPGILTSLAHLFPTWPVVPTQDLVDKSVRDPQKRELARRNPQRYAGKPRLGTVAELLRVSEWLEKRLRDVRLPFLVLHGDCDVVTEPAASKALLEVASSQDKTLKLYPGMQHSLLQGEPDENVEIVVKDIASWLDERIDHSSSSSNTVVEGGISPDEEAA